MTRELVENFKKPDGHNALLFAYGQKGTGRAHTIFGPERVQNDVRSLTFPQSMCNILLACCGYW